MCLCFRVSFPEQTRKNFLVTKVTLLCVYSQWRSGGGGTVNRPERPFLAGGGAIKFLANNIYHRISYVKVDGTYLGSK